MGSAVSWRLRKTVILVTELPPESVRENLHQLLREMQPAKGALPDPLMPAPFGQINAETFALVWRQGFMHHLAPLVVGSYSACKSGTLLMLTFTLQSYMAFFTSVGALLSLLTVVLFTASGYRPDVAFYILLSVACVYVFIRYSFEQNCRRAERQLEAILHAGKS